MTPTMINRKVSFTDKAGDPPSVGVVSLIDADGRATLYMGPDAPDAYVMSHHLDVLDDHAVALTCVNGNCSERETFAITAGAWNAAGGALEHSCGGPFAFASEATLGAPLGDPTFDAGVC